MTILNFDVTCKVSKKKVMRMERTTIYHEDKKVRVGQVSAHDGKIIAEALLAKVSLVASDELTQLFEAKPESLVEEMTYLRDIRDMAIELRTKSSIRGYSRRQSVGDEFRSSMKVRSNWIAHDLDKSKLAVPQLVVLSNIIGADLTSDICVKNYYDVPNDDTSELDSIEDSLKRMRGGSVYRTYLITKINALRNEIEAYRNIVKDAGDDLINWGQHKISRWLNVNHNIKRQSDTINYVGYHAIISMIEVTQDKLRAKGVTPTPRKAKSTKPTRSDNLEARFNRGEESFTQEELVTLLKKGNNTTNLMEMTTVLDLYEQGKKVKVTRKAVTTFLNGLQARMFETISNDGEFKRIWNFFGREEEKPEDLSYDERRYLNIFREKLSIPFTKIVEFRHLLDDYDLEQIILKSSEKLDIPDEMFDDLSISFVIGIRRKELLHHYVKRMTQEQQERFLFMYHTEKKRTINLSWEDHNKLLNTLDYGIVKKALLNSFRETSREMEELFLSKNDVEGCKFVLMRGAIASRYGGDEGRVIELFDELSFTDRYDVITQGEKEYYEVFKQVFTEEEDLEILTKLDSNEDRSQAIRQLYMGRENPRPYLELILSLGKDTYIPSTTSLLECLNKTKKLKAEFLKQGHILDFEAISRGGYGRYGGWGDCEYGLGEQFYDCFTRKQILEMSGQEGIAEHRQSSYLKKFMGLSEMFLVADQNREFKVRYVEELGYGYFQKVAHLFNDGMTSQRHDYFKKYASSGHYSRGSGLTNEDKAFMRAVKAIITEAKVA